MRLRSLRGRNSYGAERGTRKLVVIGGAEDREGDCVILKEFVRLAKGDKARVVVMTVATDHPEEVGADYKKVFRRLGAADVKVVDVLCLTIHGGTTRY